MNELKIGFIGCGRHAGLRIYPSLELAGLKLVATCDFDSGRAEKYAQRWGAARSYTDHRTMCDKEELDAILLVTGPQGHFELGKNLVEMGFSVWMEKPPAPTASQTEELAETAEKNEQHVQVGFNYRYTAGVQRAKKKIKEGEFGKPFAVAVRWWLGAQDGEHFLHHYLCHAVDLLSYLAGPLRNIHTRKISKGKRFCYFTTFDASDCVAILEAGNHMDIRGPWCRIDWYSENGMLSCSGFEEVALIPGAPVDGESGFEKVSLWPPASALPVEGGSLYERWGYVPELRHFASAVQGKESGQCTIADALIAMQIGEKMLSAPVLETP